VQPADQFLQWDIYRAQKRFIEYGMTGFFIHKVIPARSFCRQEPRAGMKFFMRDQGRRYFPFHTLKKA
jgi:hypothetical protein